MGRRVGLVDGDLEGTGVVGARVGLRVGFVDGARVGRREGLAVGKRVGDFEGARVGPVVGTAVGYWHAQTP